MLLILITGLPGTGKTTFAKALAQEAGLRHLNTDIIRDTLNLRGNYNPEVKRAVYAAMLRQTEEALKAGQRIIVDATFYREDLRKPYEALAAKSGAAVAWIEIKASDTLIAKRVNHKRQYSEADYKVYQKIKAEYEPLQQEHLVLWSTDQNLEEMIHTALIHLNLPSKKEPKRTK